jgi:prepilin-type N-terminal cleavage/methylation domain-containing protein
MDRKAFTLIELLIAATIFSIVVLSLYSAFSTGLLSYQKIDAAFGVDQAARILFNRMEQDLKNSVTYTDEDYKFIADSRSISFFTVINTYDRQGNTQPVFSRIKYELSTDTLKRTSFMGLEALKREGQAQGKESNFSVRDITFRYIATGNAEQPLVTQDVWPKDDAQKKIFPLAVRIKLSLIEKGRRGQETVVDFEKIIPLPLGG